MIDGQKFCDQPIENDKKTIRKPQAADICLFFILEKAKKTFSDFSMGTVRLLYMCSMNLF